MQCAQTRRDHPYWGAARCCGARCRSTSTRRRARWNGGCARPSGWAHASSSRGSRCSGVVVGLSLAPTPESAALEERFVSERIAAAVEVLLDAVLPDAALLVIDDARFMDEASTALVGFLAGGHRCAALAARRRAALRRRRLDAPEGVEPVRIPLAPLDPARRCCSSCS